MNQQQKDANREARQAAAAETAARPAQPFVPPPYAYVVKAGANALANLHLQANRMPMSKNAIALVDQETREACMLYSKTVVDVVSAIGERAAQAAGMVDGEGNPMNQPAPTPQERVCRTCRGVSTGCEVDSVGGTATITYVCGAEDLVFAMGEAAEQVRVRRVCKNPVVGMQETPNE